MFVLITWVCSVVSCPVADVKPPLASDRGISICPNPHLREATSAPGRLSPIEGIALLVVISPFAPLNEKRPRSPSIPRKDERLVQALS